MDISFATILLALTIFLLRVSDMTLDTIRVLFVFRGKRGLAWVLGFFQSLLFVLAITSVLSNLDNILNIIGYAAGFATGNVIGMIIESRLAIGHIHVTVMSPMSGSRIAEALRKEGFAVTEISGRGRSGMVSVMHIDVLRKLVDQVETIVLELDPQAFITAEEVRPVRRGFWRA
ncbi:MAG: hypothetical protein CVU39_04750 [Chloroflexi bacterium HGW-Chloroflexi-10]|nr:MAG: hypothetical protein CVU39_04750 [Chloroflexi bacterium HGW-Chloroflexi-10]